MKHIIKCLCLFIVFQASSQNQDTLTLAPVVIGNAGEVVEMEEYILSYTLGEFAIETLPDDPAAIYILAQGFHQPDIDIIDAVRIEEFDGSIVLYPNPTENLLTLEVEFTINRNIDLQIIDISGSVIIDQKHTIQQGTIQVDAEHLPSGSYFLRLYDQADQKQKTIKLLKI